MWRCIYDLLYSDLTTGYGCVAASCARTCVRTLGGARSRRLDFFWSPACAPRATAIIHAHAILHADGGAHSRRPNAMSRGGVESVLLQQRLLARGLAGISGLAEYGELMDAGASQ